MRGLPFNAVKDEILEFLSGINVINRENGVFLIKTLISAEIAKKQTNTYLKIL